MQKHAFSLVVFAALLSGVSGLIVKHMQIPATSMAWIRMTTPSLIIGAYLLWRGRSILKTGYRVMLAGSVFNTIRMIFFFMAYIHTTIANAIIVLYTWPIFAVILSIVFLKENVTKRQIFLLMISFVGILVVYAGHEFSLKDGDFLGLTAGILGAFFYACSVIIFKSQTVSFDPFETIFFQNILGVFVFLPLFLTNSPAPRNLDWVLGITHGTLIGIIMFAAFFYGLRYIKASTASMITYIEIISATSLGYLVLGETLTPNMILGAVIILCSTVLLQRKSFI